MLISQDATYTAGSTGGAATTTLITANLPSHSHTATVTDPGHTHTHNAQQQNTSHQLAGGGSQTVVPTAATINSATTGITVTNSSTGSGTAATTISPYIAVYMWNRTV
jgi:microcystin-dependent protein